MKHSQVKHSRFFQIMLSIIAAFFGVQTDKNRQQDFNANSPLPFILMGIFIALLLILGLIAIVFLVLD